jgi:hypothetical protein|nr:MAG TPA: hypothetical protein [Caudoviricetes sp.]
MKQFALGTLVTTRDVHDKMTRDSQFAEFVLTCIARHKTCDWGDLCNSDKRQNDEAVRTGDDRIFSAYEPADHPDWHIWIITEWDRSVTTVLFPDEY